MKICSNVVIRALVAANPKYPALPSTTTKNYIPRKKKKNGSKKKK